MSSTIETIPTPNTIFRFPLTLHSLATGRSIVLAHGTWSLALHLAATESTLWPMAGTLLDHPGIPAERRAGYLSAQGQRIEATDAAAIAAALRAALTRYWALTDAERTEVGFVPQRHPAQGPNDAFPWLRVAPGKANPPIYPFVDLQAHLQFEPRGVDFESSRTMRGLLRLAEILVGGGDFLIQPDTPGEFLDPREEVALVRALPRRNDQPQRFEAAGRDRGAGDCFLVLKRDAEIMLANNSVEMMIDENTPLVPPALPSFPPSTPGRFARATKAAVDRMMGRR